MNKNKKILWTFFESVYFTIGFIIISQIIQLIYPVPWGDISLKDIYFMLPFGIILFFIGANIMMIIFKEKYTIQENFVVYGIYNWLKNKIKI